MFGIKNQYNGRKDRRQTPQIATAVTAPDYVILICI